MPQSVKKKVSSSGKVATSATQPPPRSPAKSIFDTPTARKNIETYDKVTGEHDTNFDNVANKMFEIVLAKQKIAASGPAHLKDVDFEKIRTYIFDAIGDSGWETLFLVLAQCARLWAEIPGPVEMDATAKKQLHAMSRVLGEMAIGGGRQIDRFSSRRARG